MARGIGKIDSYCIDWWRCEVLSGLQFYSLSFWKRKFSCCHLHQSPLYYNTVLYPVCTTQHVFTAAAVSLRIKLSIFQSTFRTPENSVAVTYTSHHSIIMPFFILFAPHNMYLQQQLSPSVSNCRYFNQPSEHQKRYKCNICFATVLMHKITATGYCKWHEVCILFQMEQPSAER